MKAWRFGILSAMAGVSIVAGGAEVLLCATETPRPTRYDATLGWRVKADFHHLYTVRTEQGHAYDVLYRSDADGFRRYHTGSGPTLSILALGDSFTMDIFAGDDRMWYAVLARGLAERLGVSVDVTAAGAPGYGTLQELLVGRDAVRNRGFDLLVLQSCANDFAENSLEWSASLVRRDGYDVRPFAVLSSPTQIVRSRGVFAWMGRHVGTRSRLWQRLEQGIANIRYRQAIDQAGGNTSLAAQVNALVPDRPALHDSTMALTTRLFRDVRGLLPDRPAFTFTCWDRPALPLNQKWSEIARQAGFVNIPGVPEAVHAAQEQGRDVRAEDRVHWAPKGQAIAGQVVLNRIASSLVERDGASLLPDGAMPLPGQSGANLSR